MKSTTLEVEVNVNVQVTQNAPVAFIVTRLDPATLLVDDGAFLADPDGSRMVFLSRKRAQKAGHLKFGAKAGVVVVGMGADKFELFKAENKYRIVS